MVPVVLSVQYILPSARYIHTYILTGGIPHFTSLYLTVPYQNLTDDLI